MTHGVMYDKRLMLLPARVLPRLVYVGPAGRSTAMASSTPARGVVRTRRVLTQEISFNAAR